MTANRIGAIEGMRGVAALYVGIGHVATMIDPSGALRATGSKPDWLAALVRPLWFGHLAVAAFIVISGFCLQWALAARGQDVVPEYGSYIRRRCRRILPPYYACLVLSLITCWFVTRHQSGPPWNQYLPVTAENTLAHFALIHNVRPDWMYKINGVLWSIAIEFQIYFLFPWFTRWTAGRGRWLLVPVLALGCWLVLASYPTAMKLYVWYLPLFGLGMVAAKLATTHSAGHIAWPWLGLAAFAAAGWLASTRKDLIPSDAAIGIAAAAWMIAVIGRPQGLLACIFGWRPILILGTFSYSLYLMHHPILQWVHTSRPPGLDTLVRQFAWLGGIGIPVALLGCWLFFLAFERPFIGSARRRAVEAPS